MPPYPRAREGPSAREHSRAALGELVRHDVALDLGGALPDPVDAHLAPEPFGDVLAHVAAAAEDLHSAVGDPTGHLARVELGHRALRVLDLEVDAPVDVLRELVGH